jgi:hypothetical protein
MIDDGSIGLTIPLNENRLEQGDGVLGPGGAMAKERTTRTELAPPQPFVNFVMRVNPTYVA